MSQILSFVNEHGAFFTAEIRYLWEDFGLKKF